MRGVPYQVSVLLRLLCSQVVPYWETPLPVLPECIPFRLIQGTLYILVLMSPSAAMLQIYFMPVDGITVRQTLLRYRFQMLAKYRLGLVGEL